MDGIIELFVKAEAADYEYILYGNYPQSRVTDESIIDKLNILDVPWIDFGYHSDGKNNQNDPHFNFLQYKDVFYKGYKYRGIILTKHKNEIAYRSPTEEEGYDENRYGYEVNEVYWFKYEPILWRVLDRSTGLIMCEKTIDAQPMNIRDSDVYANSFIREWLNCDFYNTAFSEQQKDNIIVSYDLDNEDVGSTTYSLSFPNSDDKIFLLSYSEAVKTQYGFLSSDNVIDPNRKTTSTDYAKSQNVSEGYWWLRTPCRYAGYSMFWRVYNGRINGKTRPWYSVYGIRPVCRLKNIRLDTELEYRNYEENLYTSRLPTMSDTDARMFLSFVFNQDFMNVNLSDDPMYRLLRGQLDYLTVDELRGYIDAFLLLIEGTIEKNISVSYSQNSLFIGSLIERLNKELGGVSGVDEEAFQAISAPYIKKLKDNLAEGLFDMMSGVVTRLSGVIFTDSIYEHASAVLKGINGIKYQFLIKLNSFIIEF